MEWFAQSRLGSCPVLTEKLALSAVIQQDASGMRHSTIIQKKKRYVTKLVGSNCYYAARLTVLLEKMQEWQERTTRLNFPYRVCFCMNLLVPLCRKLILSYITAVDNQSSTLPLRAWLNRFMILKYRIYMKSPLTGLKYHWHTVQL